MRTQPGTLILLLLTILSTRCAPAGIPVFQYTAGAGSYTLFGRDPRQGGTTTIRTLVVPVALMFNAGKAGRLDATPDMPRLLQSPVFTPFAFASGSAQYADAMLRSTFPQARNWHTVLAPEAVKTVSIDVPPGFGYLLTSRKSGGSLAIVDIEFVQRKLMAALPRHSGELILAVTRNTAWYTEGDATLCCSWGTHGIDTASGTSFVLASYLSGAPAVVKDQDVQPLTSQLGEFVNDPLHDPLTREGDPKAPGNRVPAWLRPASMRPGDQGPCGGSRVSTPYFLLEPTDTNRKNNLPLSAAFLARTSTVTYHLQNVALLPWFVGPSASFGSTLSFPDPRALATPAAPCPSGGARQISTVQPAAAPVPASVSSNGHRLIGYWTGHAGSAPLFRLTEISPQWDVVIVAFATPDKKQEGTLNFRIPRGYDEQQFKGDIAALKARGRKVMISLGGGGEFFQLTDPKHISYFVDSVGAIVRRYGFDGIDIDFETPSLVLDPGDTDFRHPTTPSVVNLISGLRQLRSEFGPGFMISLVPEGPQMPAGFVTYGGQFGSFLPIAFALRDMLSFTDTQDYNAPPLQGLDGEIYQAGTVDYHAALTELPLRGFPAGRDPAHLFPPIPGARVAIGFLTGETSPPVVTQALDYLIRGKAPAGATYQLRNPGGYGSLLGAMFWTIDDDRAESFRFSNAAGSELHGYGKQTR